jgi:hypothetical protein
LRFGLLDWQLGMHETEFIAHGSETAFKVVQLQVGTATNIAVD